MTKFETLTRFYRIASSSSDTYRSSEAVLQEAIWIIYSLSLFCSLLIPSTINVCFPTLIRRVSLRSSRLPISTCPNTCSPYPQQTLLLSPCLPEQHFLRAPTTLQHDHVYCNYHSHDCRTAEICAWCTG